MIRQTIDLFRKTQYMNREDYEIFNYSDAVPPKGFPHTHSFYEIYYALSDGIIYAIGTKEYHLKKGDLVLMPPGMLHYLARISLAPGERYSRIVLWCNLHFFEGFTEIDSSLNYMWDHVIQNHTYHIRPTSGESLSLYNCMLRLIEEQRNPVFSSDALSFSILMEIFVRINRIIYGTKHFEKACPARNMFSSIISYIHTHLSDELSLDVLSQNFFVTKGYISRLFREYMGISVHQYILSLRLERSRKAIKCGTPILTAASMYGFGDYSSFYRAFKNAFSISPKEYADRELKTD